MAVNIVKDPPFLTNYAPSELLLSCQWCLCFLLSLQKPCSPPFTPFPLPSLSKLSNPQNPLTPPSPPKPESKPANAKPAPAPNPNPNPRAEPP